MERVKTFVNGGREYPADLNEIQDRAAELLEGTAAALPGSHFAGRYYRATDTKDLYLDNGAAWEKIAGKEAIKETNLGPESVSEGKLKNLAVTGPKLGSGTVRQETGTTQSFLSWGVISGTGVVEAGSNDYTAKEASAGSIEIIWTKAKASALYSVVAMPFISEGAVTPFCRERTTTKILIEMRLAGGGFASDPFMFQVLASS